MGAAVLIIPNELVRRGVEAALRDWGRLAVGGSYASVDEALAAGARGRLAIVHADAAEDPLRRCAELRALCAPNVVVLARQVEPGEAAAFVAGGARAIVLEADGRLELVAAVAAATDGAAHVEGHLLRRLLDLGFRRPPEAGPLDPRELRIVELLAAGCSHAEIGARLGLAEKTVRNLCSARVYPKLGARNRGEAVGAARSAGLVTGAAPPS